jgi:hypothetical protein
MLSPWLFFEELSGSGGRHRQILFAARGERQREALHGRRKPCLPQNAAGICVESSEHAIQVAHERHAARGCKHSRQEQQP